MGLFNRFKLDIKPLTKNSVDSFKDSFEKLASQLMDNKMENANTPKPIQEKEFEILWGKEMPQELRDILGMFHRLGLPKFNKWETALPNMDIAHQEGNIVKDVLLKAQVEFPTDHHINWFTGSASMDPVVNNGNRWNGANYSFQYPLYEPIPGVDKAPQIYMYHHNHPDSWGTSFELMAKDANAFLYINMLIQARVKKKISDADFVTCFEKIKDKVKLPYYFFNSFSYNGRWISYYDFNYRAGSDRGSTLTLDYYNRSRWIFELLKGNHNNYLWSIQNSMYSKYLNPKLDDERHQFNLGHLQNHVPDALYYLLRCYFRDETKQLKEYINICKDSPARIIRDAALFAEELNGGLEFFGEIDNIQTLKREFATNMRW